MGWIGRQGFMLGGIAALTAASSRAAATMAPIAEIERRQGGRLGVFAVDNGSGRILSHRADERFLMCSTFKLPLAAQILARIEAGRESPDRSVGYGKGDLIFASPVTAAHVRDGALTVRDLCAAMVERSDNTAAILMMRSVGGPSGLTGFLRGLGDEVTRSDRFEPDANRYDGAKDTTTPRAMAGVVRKLLLGDALGAASRERLEGWMIAATPGLDRLRASFPKNWRAGDRPGTSDERESNDVVLARPPGRAPLLIAAYYDAPGVDADHRDAVLREVGRAVVTWGPAEIRVKIGHTF